ncbi:MAG: DUF4465 domain-containing protein [Muribaculaceae bacterium]|nr:DUF4465 domain-containing protein [Muribaculaceae bacterium]
MKLNRILLPALMAAAMCSCSNDPKDDPDNDWIVNFDTVTAFTKDAYWEFCYDKEYENSLTFTNFGESVNFSHSCDATEYGGIVYYSWKGFTPSCATDLSDYTAQGTWIEHQWTAMPGRGCNGSDVYMVGFCDATETADDALTSTTAVITAASTKTFCPKTVYITNTTYGYYSMKNGSAFNKAFTDADWCKLTFTGVDNGVVTGAVDFYLAKDGEYATKWTAVDLKALNKCEKVVITMESSDTGQFGMNNASYFALGSFIWGY